MPSDLKAGREPDDAEAFALYANRAADLAARAFEYGDERSAVVFAKAADMWAEYASHPPTQPTQENGT